MDSTSEVLKVEIEELPVPDAWRRTIFEIVESLSRGDFDLSRIPNVLSLHDEQVEQISRSIEHYGCKLIPLPAEAWDTSSYIWMRGYWEVLVDLFTEEEGRSDLVLFLRIQEDGDNFLFNVSSVHVP